MSKRLSFSKEFNLEAVRFLDEGKKQQQGKGQSFCELLIILQHSEFAGNTS